MHYNLVVSITDNGGAILDVYNTAVKSGKKRLFGKKKNKGRIDVVMASYPLSKEQLKELIDILEDALEEIDDTENEEMEDVEEYY